MEKNGDAPELRIGSTGVNEGICPVDELGRVILMLGAGGHAESLLATLKALGLSAGGSIRPGNGGAQLRPDPLPWLGDDEFLSRLDRRKFLLINGIGSVADLTLRRTVFERFRAEGFTFLSVAHPSAIVEEDVLLGEGAQVMAGVILQTGVRIGANSIVNTGAIVDHGCEIGEHVHLAPGVRLSGNVRIGHSAHVGTGATIIQGVKIGAAALVAAGAVVTADVAPRQRVGGAPARELNNRFAKEGRRSAEFAELYIDKRGV